MNLPEIRKVFKYLYDRGFVESKRKGPTGIGYTLEAELGLAENNIAMPDFGSIELKSVREGTRRLITLFTLNRIAWQPSAKEVILKYGYEDKKRNRIALYCAVTGKPNPQGLFIENTPNTLKINHISGNVVGLWDKEIIIDKITEKMQAVILVKAETTKRDGLEFFWYKSAEILSACNYDTFFEMIRDGRAIIDIRMHIKPAGQVRNHGTGFRIYENLLEQLYSNQRNLT